MKNLFILCFCISMLYSCDSVYELTEGTKKTNQYLERLLYITESDSLDILCTRISYNELYSTNIVWDSSYLISENWFRFEIKVKPDPVSSIILSYKGYVQASNPDLLFIESVEEIDTATKFSDAMTLIEEKSASMIYIPQRILKTNNDEWNKILLSGHADFDGFEIKNKNFNYLNLNNYSFNFTRLVKDTLYKVYAIAPKRIELPDNTFNGTVFHQSLISNADFRNWHFVSNSLTNTTLWYDSKIHTTDFNDVVLRNFKIYLTEFNSCVFRHANYGSFKKMIFSKTIFNSVTFDAAYVESSKFVETTMSGWITNSDFVKVTFMGSQKPTRFNSMSRINGRFNNCSFNSSVEFNNSRIIGSQFWLGTFNEVKFLNNCYITNTIFKDMTILRVDYGNTGISEVTFGDANSNYPMRVMSCNFKNVKWGTNVKFVNCDLSSSTFPPRSELDEKGVKFIDCLNEPKD